MVPPFSVSPLHNNSDFSIFGHGENFTALLLLRFTSSLAHSPRGFQTTAIKTSLGKHLNANSPFPKNVLSDFFLLFASESGALIVH